MRRLCRRGFPPLSSVDHVGAPATGQHGDTRRGRRPSGGGGRAAGGDPPQQDRPGRAGPRGRDTPRLPPAPRRGGAELAAAEITSGVAPPTPDRGGHRKRLRLGFVTSAAEFGRVGVQDGRDVRHDSGRSGAASSVTPPLGFRGQGLCPWARPLARCDGRDFINQQRQSDGRSGVLLSVASRSTLSTD